MARGLIPYALVVLGAIGIWWHGYGTGRKAERIDTAALVQALEDQLARVSTANRAAAAELQARRVAHEALVRELENEARDDPDAVSRTPSPDSLQRLERRWTRPD